MNQQCDVLLVGAGIMSATVGLLLKELDPSLRVVVVEKLDHVAGESTAATNNAGTGHAGLCELNYTGQLPDGTIDIRKAVKVMEAFEVGKQLWASFVELARDVAPGRFIQSVPHCSFVRNEEDLGFLRRRHAALRQHPLFVGMRFSSDPRELAEWLPLVMQARSTGDDCAATWSSLGTDVNFGALATAMFAYLERRHGVPVLLGHEVRSLTRDDRDWTARFVRAEDGAERPAVEARFVFVGAGGGALPLIERAELPEATGYGGFPVSGQWLVCRNPGVMLQHFAKVYGMAEVGAPPMSVPHLDTRFLDGKRALLFGPFAGFSTRFLKQGSYLDLPSALNSDNVLPLLSAGLRNLGLTQYLVQQVSMTFDDKFRVLRDFLPEADPRDWALEIAGQRVQVIKQDRDGGGTIEFGTEIVSARDNSLAALLGASPGASTSVAIALDLLADCFPTEMASAAWQRRLVELIPSFGQSLGSDAKLASTVRAATHDRLGLVPA